MERHKDPGEFRKPTALERSPHLQETRVLPDHTAAFFFFFESGTFEMPMVFLLQDEFWRLEDYPSRYLKFLLISLAIAK